MSQDEPGKELDYGVLWSGLSLLEEPVPPTEDLLMLDELKPPSEHCMCNRRFGKNVPVRHMCPSCLGLR